MLARDTKKNYLNAGKGSHLGPGGYEDVLRVHHFAGPVFFQGGNLIYSGDFAMTLDQGYLVLLEQLGDTSR